MSRLRIALAAASVAVALLVAGAGAAIASPIEAAPVVMADGSGCTTPSRVTPVEGEVVSSGCQSYPDGSYLPVLRWSGSATSLHYKAEGGLSHIVSDMSTWLQRDGTWPLWMTIGNTMWSWATSIVSFGVRAQPLEAAGFQVDRAVASLGDAMSTQGLVLMLVVVAIGSILWRGMRSHQVPWAQAGRVVLVVGLIFAMTLGASRSTKDAEGRYVAGTMSPGWAVNLVNDTISTIASAPAAAISASSWSDDLSGYGAASADDDGACTRYVDELYARYQSGVQGDGTIMAAISVDMSRMWEQTGLQAWRSAQFGERNPYGEYVYCHLLESRAQVAPTQQIALAGAGTKYPAANPASGAWGTGDDSEALDRSLIAWAACRPTADGGWTVASDWDRVKHGDGTIDPDTCAKWWTDSFFNPVDFQAVADAANAQDGGVWVYGDVCGTGAVATGQGCLVKETAEMAAWGGVCEYHENNLANPLSCRYVDDETGSNPRSAGPPACTSNYASSSCLSQMSGKQGGILTEDDSPLDWAGSATKTINDTASAPATQDFILSLHGRSNVGGTLAVTLTYAIGSLIVLLTFGALGIGVFIAKLWALVVMAVLLVVMMRDIVITNEPSATVKLARQYVGVAFFAFGLQLVFALVTLLAGAMVAMGAGWFAPGSTESMAWLAMAPAVSVLVLHFVFTKTLKLPSPFTVGGVKTWGAAAAGGAVGGALGSGAGAMLGGQARRAGRAVRRGASQAVMSRVGTGGAMRRRRAGAFTAGAAGVASAAAVESAFAHRRGHGRPGRRDAHAPDGRLEAPTGVDAASARAAERQAEREALLDGGQVGAERLAGQQRRAALKEARRQQKQETLDRRGYGHGVAGDAREAFSARQHERLEQVQQQFREHPLRSSLGLTVGTAAKTAGVVGLVVGTGGLAAPLLAAGATAKGVRRTRAARQEVITDYRARQEALQAAQAAEAARLAAEAKRRTRGPARVRVQQAPAGSARPSSTGRAQVAQQQPASW